MRVLIQRAILRAIQDSGFCLGVSTEAKVSFWRGDSVSIDTQLRKV